MPEPTTLPADGTGGDPARTGKVTIHCGDCGVMISPQTRAAHANCFAQHRNPQLKAADPTRCTIVIDGTRCPKPIKARDWCNGHLQRWNKTGDPTTPHKRRAAGVLLTQVKDAACATPDDCILVPCDRSRPSLMYRGKPTNAARAVWREATGKDPGDAEVIFTCGRGNDGCINIRHLRLSRPDPEALCEVCGKPAAPENRLKAGKHVNYCYQWARRNNPSSGRCRTEGCGRPTLNRQEGLCSRCDQRRLRGNDPAARDFHMVNKGKTCKVSWCDESATHRGWCDDCYAWQRRNQGADPTERRYRYDRTEDDIMTMVMAIPPNPVTGCRDSTGVFSQDECGYPLTSVAGKAGVRVTRLVVSKMLGRPMKRATHACHTCDNPPCVEPTHLWEGTAADNSHDRDTKGRGARGVTNGRSRLNPDKVRSIRARYVPGNNQHEGNVAALAAEFGVKPQTIRDVVHRRTWHHVE